MPPRIPTPSDFTHLLSKLPHTVHFPSPPESTTSFLLLLHGFGDSEVSFSQFARGMNLPGVCAITVRGTSPLPASLLSDEISPSSTGARPPEGGGPADSSWHWGDDVRMDERTGDIDADPGFEKAVRQITEDLIDGVIVRDCGWNRSDVMIFGFGQGGSLALGMASALRRPWNRVTGHDTDGQEETDGSVRRRGLELKGVVSLGGPLPVSTVPTVSATPKSRTKVLLVQADEDVEDLVKREFEHVQTVRWTRSEVGMPRDREEMFPIMKFFADRLKSGW